MRRPALLHHRLLVLAALVALGVGCNAILDNKPGIMGSDVAPNEPSGDDTAAPDRGPSSQDDGDATTPVSGSGPDGENAPPDAAADTERCAPGSKACGDLCVSPDDPFFGCASTTCARCNVPNATAACVAGACAVGLCAAGFADCNGDPRDGCETDVGTVASCGACGIACPVRPHVAVACVAGACTGVCDVGWGDCNGKPQDGCERNLMTDEKHCGACGTRCVIGKCELGTCVWP